MLPRPGFLGVKFAVFWSCLDTHIGLVVPIVRRGVPRGAKLMKKAPFGTHIGSILAASLVHLGGCWAILGRVFAKMFAGMFWEADVEAK